MIFYVIYSMYIAYAYTYQSLFLVYILAYKLDILQIFKSTVYLTCIVRNAMKGVVSVYCCLKLRGFIYLLRTLAHYAIIYEKDT